MNKLRTYAKTENMEVYQDCSGAVVVNLNGKIYVCDKSNAYEAIVDFAPTPDERRDLLKQWAIAVLPEAK